MEVIYMLVFYLLLLGALVWLNVVIANAFSRVAAMKGHPERKYFWYCFWLGAIGYVVVISLPDCAREGAAAFDLPPIPSERPSSPGKPKDTKKIVWVAVVFAVLILAMLVAAIAADHQATADYATSFNYCVSVMFDGASDAEEAGGLIHDVWYNCIYEVSDYRTDEYTRKNYGFGAFYDDFNDAIDELNSDSSFKSKIRGIEANQKRVAGLMKDLKKPPKEFEDAYDALRDLYDAYCDLTECAVNPSGNLTTYTATFNSADSDFVRAYRAVKVYQ